MMLRELLKTNLPAIAILRGITAEEVVPVCEQLVGSGIRVLEVPLNSPDPFDSIARIVERFDGEALVGAGTVLTAREVDRLHAIGAQLVVAPNLNARVVERCQHFGMTAVPGVMTPTEALTAHSLGVEIAKLFPAGQFDSSYFKDLQAILPVDFDLVAVGGIDAENAAGWLDAGVIGLGLGSSLYQPGDTPSVVKTKADAFAEALNP